MAKSINQRLQTSVVHITAEMSRSNENTVQNGDSQNCINNTVNSNDKNVEIDNNNVDNSDNSISYNDSNCDVEPKDVYNTYRGDKNSENSNGMRE